MKPVASASEVRRGLVGRGVRVGATEVAEAVRDRLGWRGDEQSLVTTLAIAPELLGAGPLESLLGDPGVSDVCVNGVEQVWADRGRGMVAVGALFDDRRKVRELAVRLAELGGHRLDDASPCVDARLPGGIRLHAVLPPVAPDGPLISLRTGRLRAFSLAELVTIGSIDEGLTGLLPALVRAPLSFLVTGGAGSGKTTLLSALLSLLDPAERVVLVEDVGELRPALPHVVRLESRAANAEGAGAIGLDRLVREALRMRPDRIVVGECRGVEILDLLAALNTGSSGAATVHANRLADTPARLEALGARAGLARAALHSQFAAAVTVGLHIARTPAGRRLSEVAMTRRNAGGIVSFETAWLDTDAGWRPGPAASRLEALLDKGSG